MENKPKRALWSVAVCQEPAASPIPVEHFEQAPAFVGKDKEGTAFGVLLEPFTNESV